ncbi:unnamed protein product [Effrenium voratum]|nr:unnamed protein product [Effrenium voratum]
MGKWRLCWLLLCASALEEVALDTEEAETECSVCPVRLLDVVSKEGEEDGAGLRLSSAGLEYLEKQRSPLFLVPALGVYRGGKSLLLNRLMGRKAPYAAGFGVGHGQETFTRGIQICAEALPERQGTVVWMDTEGLFSSEDARSAGAGAKIFSLALLFSSVVLLNNLKVLNQQFFVFFEEQQQVARVLREGLRAEGMPSDLLLPENLSIVWVLQQPINFAGTPEAGQAQLDSFLTIQDKARERVRESFRHLIHEVPSATHDARQWPKLDQLADEELLPEYLQATSGLRELLSNELQHARPMQAASIAAHLRMYVDLVQSDHFSISLAREAFEDSHAAQLCEAFGAAAQDLAGEMPCGNLSSALDAAEMAIQERQEAVMKDFHLDQAFLSRLKQCFQRKRQELELTNQELVLAEWEKEVQKAASTGGCFFLSKLAASVPRYKQSYGAAFTKVEAKAKAYAQQMQRTRFTGCVVLRHLLLPILPWLAWPVINLYIRQGVLQAVLTMMLHGVVLAGVYSILQSLGRLPYYLDLEYPVLQHHSGLQELVLRAPQIPWAFLASASAFVGWIRVAWLFSVQIFRPVEVRTIGQLSNLELKLNTIMERSQADLKEKVVTAALDAALHIDGNDPAAAALALVKGLLTVSQVSQDLYFVHAFEAEHRELARKAVKNFHFPDKADLERRLGSCKADAARLVEKATGENWDKLIPIMEKTLVKLTGQDGEPSASKEKDLSDMEVERLNMDGARDAAKEAARGCAAARKEEASASCADPTEIYASARQVSIDDDVERERIKQELVKETEKDAMRTCMKESDKTGFERCMGQVTDVEEIAGQLFEGLSAERKENKQQRAKEEAAVEVVGERFQLCMEASETEEQMKACRDEIRDGASMAGLMEDVEDVVKKYQRNTVAIAARACNSTQRKACVDQAKEELKKSGLKERAFGVVRRLAEMKAAAETWAACQEQSAEANATCNSIAQAALEDISGSAEAWTEEAAEKVLELGQAMLEGKEIVLRKLHTILLEILTDALECSDAVLDKLADRAQQTSDGFMPNSTMGMGRNVSNKECKIVWGLARYTCRVHTKDLNETETDDLSDVLSTDLGTTNINVRRLGRRLAVVTESFAAQEEEETASDGTSTGTGTGTGTGTTTSTGAGTGTTTTERGAVAASSASFFASNPLSVSAPLILLWLM